MIKSFLSLALCIFLVNTVLSGQTNKEQFDALAEKRDTAGQRKLLEKWQLADSNDAELYVAWFNFYVNKSHNYIITLGNEPEGEALQLMITDTTIKEPAGYLYSQTDYDPVLLQKGFDYIAKGIKKHPARLDMRFGEVYMYGVLKDWEKFTTEIIKTIDYSATIKNKWLWTNNKPVENPKVFMLSAVQTYQLQLYETMEDALVENMKRIALTVLKYYPDHVESLSNLAIVYMVHEDYDNALEALLKAEKTAPKDDIVLANIAHCYKMKGDTQNAIKYYKLMLQYGDEAAKEFAQGELDILQTK
jgi:tetratricopeptide (TPR) repeat protein